MPAKYLLDNLDSCCNVQEELARPNGEIFRVFDKRVYPVMGILFVFLLRKDGTDGIGKLFCRW